MQLTTDGIILSDYKTNDDRILTILTREQGVLTAYANGANKLSAKLSATTELLCYSRLVIFSHRGRNIVDSADSLHIFFNLRSDLEKLSLASYFAELAKELSPKNEPADSQLSLLLNCLSFIENGKRDSRLLKALLELRLLTLAGYMPQLVGCRVCNSFDAEEMLFFPPYGELLCGSCSTDEDKRQGIYISAGVLAAMRHIIYAPPEKLFSFTLSPQGLDSLASMSEKYLKAQLEKTLPTLEFYKSLLLF